MLAYMKLNKIRCRSKKYLTAEIAEYAEIIQFFFSAFSAISAVNSYVSFLIRLAAFQARRRSSASSASVRDLKPSVLFPGQIQLAGGIIRRIPRNPLAGLAYFQCQAAGLGLTKFIKTGISQDTVIIHAA